MTNLWLQAMTATCCPLPPPFPPPPKPQHPHHTYTHLYNLVYTVTDIYTSILPGLCCSCGSISHTHCYTCMRMQPCQLKRTWLYFFVNFEAKKNMHKQNLITEIPTRSQLMPVLFVHTLSVTLGFWTSLDLSSCLVFFQFFSLLPGSNAFLSVWSIPTSRWQDNLVCSFWFTPQIPR